MLRRKLPLLGQYLYNHQFDSVLNKVKANRRLKVMPAPSPHLSLALTTNGIFLALESTKPHCFIKYFSNIYFCRLLKYDVLSERCFSTNYVACNIAILGYFCVSQFSHVHCALLLVPSAIGVLFSVHFGTQSS